MLVSFPFSKCAPVASASSSYRETSHPTVTLPECSHYVIACGASPIEDTETLDLPDTSCRNARTRGQFKPRNANKGSSSYQLRQFAEATLGSGSLRKAVKLPEGEDLSEWLAVNGVEEHWHRLRSLGLQGVVIDFYNQINLLYGSITEFCSPASCPEMKATDE